MRRRLPGVHVERIYLEQPDPNTRLLQTEESINLLHIYSAILEFQTVSHQ